MSGRRRTFVLQAAAVALLVAVIFFAFLRPSDLGDLTGIDAPEGETPQYGLPGIDRDDGEDRDGMKTARRNSNRMRGARSGTAPFVLSSGASSSGGAGAFPAAEQPARDGPAGDQYTSAVAALLQRVRGTAAAGPR